MPTLVLYSMPPLLKCTKREEKICNFLHISSHKLLLLPKHISTYSLAGCHLPCLILGPPFWGGGGGTSTTSGEGEASPPPPMKKTPLILHHYKSKEPSVNTWLTHQWAQNSMQSTCHTFFSLVTNLLICIGLLSLQ